MRSEAIVPCTRRVLYGGKDFRRAHSIEELRRIARRHVPNFAFEYVEGGAENELTLAWNRAVFDSILLCPDTLRDTTERSIAIDLFGRRASSPLILAPTGLNGMLRFRGDALLARAASKEAVPFTLSTMSNMRVEAVAAEPCDRLWMQLYMFRDRTLTEDIVARARSARCEALVLTSDANVFGSREWDKRSYRSPGKLTWRSTLDCIRRPRWMWELLVRHGIPRFENVADFFPPNARTARAGVALIPELFQPNLTWADIDWLRQIWPGRLILKGVLSTGDAKRAADAGCDGVVLTNHGGRQLDSAVSPMDVLEQIAQEVGSRITIIVDSGFRRGTDIVKALALGARAVMIGRAALYGLAAGGEAGVHHALNLLKSEVDRTLGQLGCRSVTELGTRFLRRNSN